MTDSDVLPFVEGLLRAIDHDSIRVKVETDCGARPTVRGSEPFVLYETYYQTRTGERFLDSRTGGSRSGFVSHRTSYCDSTRSANIQYKRSDPDAQESIHIGHHFGIEGTSGFLDVPRPLLAYYVGTVPLAEALPSAERLGLGSVLGRPCTRFHFKEIGRGGQSLVFWLDHETSTPLRVAAYHSPERIREDMPNWVWQATSIREVQGRHFPMESTLDHFSVKQIDGAEWTSQAKGHDVIRVTELRYDEPIEKAAFWPVIQPGASVLDVIGKRQFRQGREPAERTGEAIRVEPGSAPGSWTATGLTLVGLVLLATAAVALVRRR